MKNVDFFLFAHYWASLIFYCSYFTSVDKHMAEHSLCATHTWKKNVLLHKLTKVRKSNSHRVLFISRKYALLKKDTVQILFLNYHTSLFRLATSSFFRGQSEAIPKSSTSEACEANSGCCSTKAIRSLDSLTFSNSGKSVLVSFWIRALSSGSSIIHLNTAHSFYYYYCAAKLLAA